jgi:hypothetical protein
MKKLYLYFGRADAYEMTSGLLPIEDPAYIPSTLINNMTFKKPDPLIICLFFLDKYTSFNFKSIFTFKPDLKHFKNKNTPIIGRYFYRPLITIVDGGY